MPVPLSAAELEEVWLKIQSLGRALIDEGEAQEVLGAETAERLKASVLLHWPPVAKGEKIV